MSALFSSPKPPRLPPPPPLPDFAAEERRRRREAERQALRRRMGRAATILSEPNLGGTEPPVRRKTLLGG